MPGNRLALGITLDWQLSGVVFQFHGLSDRPPLRHFGRSPIVLVPLTEWGIKLGLVKYWHDLCQFSADREDLSEIVHRGD